MILSILHFSVGEIAMISTTEIEFTEVLFSTFDTVVTQDKVFLLSRDELCKYFNSESSRKVEVTDYVAKQEKLEEEYMEEFEGKSRERICWLRPTSVSMLFRLVPTVKCDSGYAPQESHKSYEDQKGAVRPALWIDLNS